MNKQLKRKLQNEMDCPINAMRDALIENNVVSTQAVAHMDDDRVVHLYQVYFFSDLDWEAI